jgi:hypothetical protein
LEANVDQWFEVFFRLHATQDGRVRIRLRHATGANYVDSVELPARFQVETSGVSTADKGKTPVKPAQKDERWLLDLPEGGIRDVFRHLATHGTINEADATRLLGGPRQFRKFSRELELFLVVLPFAVRVDVSSGTKCYVRGGS